MFIFLYVEENRVWLNMYALKHVWLHYAIEIVKKVQPNLKVAQNR